MKTKKIIIPLLSLICILCATFGTFNLKFASADSSVYTISEDQFDVESGLLSYRKVTYSTGTNGEYVSYPCKYEGEYTDEIALSIKYKNNGVKFLPVYMEYGAGINEGGVDYTSGEEIVCMDMFDNIASWNVSYSKSVDGYDVATIVFGSYAATVYDMSLTGFRLYFDKGLEVTEERSFEVYGLTVHNENTIPSFASDPKPCRISKVTANGAEYKDDSCTVNGTVTLSASIFDYDSEYKKLKIGFTVNNSATVVVKLDGEELSNNQYGVGSHTVTLDFVKDNYSSLEIVVTATDCLFKIDQMTLVATPYVDEFSGSNFTISKVENGTKVSYTFKTGWNSITAPIRRYTSDYDGLLIEFTVDTPIVMGIQIDGEYIRSHYEFSDPLEVGAHSFFFSLAEMKLSDSSSIEIWLDPAITGYAGVEGTKNVIFTNIQFKASSELPNAVISGLASTFNFTYDGKGKSASGATTNSGETLIYEYKLASAKESAYDTDLPVNAGEYDVRVTSPSNTEFATTCAFAKLYIAKTNAPTPTASSVNVDFTNSVVNYDPALFLVARDADFNSVAVSGSGVMFGDVLYVKYIESTNYYESESISIALDKRESKIEVTVNYEKERTTDVLDSNCEYSTDGLNWTVGTGKRVILEPGNIYLFRKKATSSSFAGEICYLAINYRPEAPVAPVLESTTNNSITLQAVENAEYRLSDTVWQSSPTFTGLKAGSEVTVYIRIKSTANAYASEEIGATFTVGAVNADSSSSTENNGDVEDKGCKGSLGGGLYMLPALVAVCLLKKKRGNA